MNDQLIKELIQEIELIQAKPYMYWISAWSNKVKVDHLHKKLDQLGYTGNRPPRSWNQVFRDK